MHQCLLQVVKQAVCGLVPDFIIVGFDRIELCSGRCTKGSVEPGSEHVAPASLAAVASEQASSIYVFDTHCVCVAKNKAA